jgi:PilZ domain
MARSRGFTKRAPRVDLRRPAVLINSDGLESGVTVLDVSSGGFRLELSESPRIGEFVTLRVEHGEEFPAQIRWALGNEAGGVFLTAAGSAMLHSRE